MPVPEKRPAKLITFKRLLKFCTSACSWQVCDGTSDAVTHVSGTDRKSMVGVTGSEPATRTFRTQRPAMTDSGAVINSS